MAARIQTISPATLAPAPVTGWRRMIRDGAVVGSTTLVCHGLGAVTSLLLRVFLDPAQMGVWQALKLLLHYGNYANLGISKGAVREYTVARGRGDTVSARQGLNLAFTVNTVTSLGYAAVLVCAGVAVGAANTTWAVGLACAGLLAVLTRYVTFHVTILRSAQAFTTTSRLALIEGLLTLVVCGWATWQWGLYGLYGGTLVVTLAALGFVHRHQAAGLGWAWNGKEVRRLVAIGGPILLAGTVASLFRSLDKIMLLGYLNDGAFQLGCYSATLMITVQLYGLANMFSVVMGPRYGEKYGHSGSRREVAQLAARATEIQAAAMALPAALAMIAAPPLLATLLPAYRPGLAPLVWLVPGVTLLSMALPASQYLVAVNYQRRALVAVTLGALVAAIGNHVALTGGFGLTGVAAATSLAYLAYFVLLVGISLWTQLTWTERFRYGGMLFLTLGPVLTLAVFFAHGNTRLAWTALAGRVTVVLIVWLATTALGWHHGGWRTQLRKPSL